MGKHRTAQQDAIFIAFMERHPMIAINYLKGDKLVPMLMDIAKELQDMNRQTRLNAQRTEANTDALLALGTQISDLMQQQLKERKRLNAVMEKFVHKMETTD
ncbi:uncharacterized protein LOC117188366 [Drosophila miranda]|uniref:uncharacterized protein LOC117188366 n=1 Tax=Drosophila miranda TaxID=7229 RepID=UPI00143F5C3F|nr:uncharacterized protein LOC117188366 [Drosophila miranda]